MNGGKYCCNDDMKAYEDYYLNQCGHGMPVLYGARMQRGHGIGSILHTYYLYVYIITVFLKLWFLAHFSSVFNASLCLFFISKHFFWCTVSHGVNSMALSIMTDVFCILSCALLVVLVALR